MQEGTPDWDERTPQRLLQPLRAVKNGTLTGKLTAELFSGEEVT